MNDVFAGKHLVLGLSGGVACYKSAMLCRLLVKAGATVQVVMTEAAEQFMTPVTMQALSGRAVYTSQWDAREPNNMPHINLSREADAILIAPCSADFIAKLAQGRSDELLSLMYELETPWVDQFSEFLQNLCHLVSTFSASDIDNDISVRPLGNLMLCHGLSGSESAGNGGSSAFGDWEHGINDTLSGDKWD